MSKKELDFADVRKLCAGIAAKEEIEVVANKIKKYAIISLSSQRKKTPANVKTLEEILLHDLSIKERDNLMKRMSTVLGALKTTDIDTARAFLRLERYSEVRQGVVKQLTEFATKDLKMTIANGKPEE